MQNSTLIKQNIHKLVLHNRKAIMNEVVQTGVLREAFNSNRLPKNLTEEQLLVMMSEGLAKDGDFILENYKILTHPNFTPERLNEGNGTAGFARFVRRIIDRIRGLGGDPKKHTPTPTPIPPSTNPAPMPEPTVPGGTPKSGIIQNESLIKQNVHKLVLHNRKTIMNEVVQTGMLREAFESKRLPKNLTEEQFLFIIGECLSEDGNFILENYKILTHPNPTPEMLNEFIKIGKVIKAIPGIIKKIPGAIDDIYKWGVKTVGWVAEQVDGVWRWVWRGDGPSTSSPPARTPGPPGPVVPKKPKPVRNNQDGEDYIPGSEPDPDDVDPMGPGGGGGPPPPDLDEDLSESVFNFNRNMKHLMESNQQIDQNLLHSMLNQVNESKYLLELAIQRNQVNRIIDRI